MIVMDMPTISRPRALLYATVVLVALVFGGRFLLEKRAEPPSMPTATFAAVESTTDTGASGVTGPGGTEAELVVHVAGAVRRPGLYLLPGGSRIDDAIELAGGPTGKANLELVNLAQLLSDGEQVLIPRRPMPGTPPGPSPASSTSAVPTGPVGLNTASLEALDSLPGVGPVTAQKILDYREQHGPFSSVDELDAIPGIGPARLGQLRDLVVP